MRGRWAAALLTTTVAIPMVLSVAVLILPLQVSSRSGAPDLGPVAPTAPVTSNTTPHCREFYADNIAGIAVTVHMRLHAQACWNGTRASEDYGMNASDCFPASSTLTVATTTLCRRTTGADGTLSFTFRNEVSPLLLPFLHRTMTVQVVIDRNGRVERFP